MTVASFRKDEEVAKLNFQRICKLDERVYAWAALAP
jgi:hypothetical protein